MRIVIALAATLITSASAMADAVSVTSPDHARTYAYGAVTWHQLYLERHAVNSRRGSPSVISPSRTRTSHAPTNRSISGFQVSMSISRGMHSLRPDAAVNSFRLPGFGAMHRVAGLSWHPTQRFICSRRAVA